jgi:hypothetical protein
MPQVQCEQHQPVKSSASAQIMRLLLMRLPDCACFWDSSSGAADGIQQASSAEGELLPADKYFPRIQRAAK